MKGILLKYNKVHNDSLRKLASRFPKTFEVLWGDLSIFGEKMDLLTYDTIENFFSPFEKLDFIVVGDVFWKTGQSICRYGAEKQVPVFFIQHGQWIYVRNKKTLEHYPEHTFMFGEYAAKMCSSWNYGKESKVSVTGSPRYDEASPNGGSYIYFSPPVIEELIHGKPSGKIRRSFRDNLEAIKKIDRELPIVIHPHYRESQTECLHELFPYAQFADPQLDALKLVRGASKVLTSRNSTAVLDAIAHHKPVVFMDLPEYDACFFERGHFGNFALESSTKTHLLDNLLSEIQVKRTDYINKTKEHIMLGDASGRIVECIKEYNEL